MDYLTRRLKVNNYEDMTYPVYTKEEADEKQVTYKPWKKCIAGDFGLSDDGYVAECIARNQYKTSIELQFSFGRMWISNKARLLYEPRRLSGNYATVSTASFEYLEGKHARTKRAVDIYTRMLLGGNSIDWSIIGKAYRPDQKRPDLTAKRLFKQEAVKNMVDKKIDKALKEKGITEGEVLDVIADAITLARTKEDPGTMLRGAEQYIRILDMLPKKAVQTDTMQIDMTSQIVDQIEKEEKRVKLEQKKEITAHGS
tara:strand:- start:8681 stop:9448 length:768 start_codon:yes stop_codon:yes gene_type:complete